MAETVASPPANPKDQVNVPSILMLLTAGIGVLSGLVSLVQHLAGSTAFSPEMVQKYMDQIQDPQAQQQIQQLMPLLQKLGAGGGAGGIIWALVGLAINGFVLFGAVKMRNLQSWGVALAAAILCVIPCCAGPCYCLGIPAGIWALVVLNRAEVKTAFVV